MRISVISPWYPDYASAYSGVFVEKQVAALASLGHDVIVEVPQIYPAPAGAVPGAVAEAIRRLAEKSFDAAYSRVDNVTYVPTPVPARSGALGRAEAFLEALDLKRAFSRVECDVTHAHLGLPTGLAALKLNASPIVVTEHQSTLAAVLSEPGAERAYAEVIERSDAFVCVSENLRNQLADRLGDWVVERVEVVPNIVDLTDIRFRQRLTTCSSWIYIGGLVPHKGIEALLRTFESYRTVFDPGASLTLVGAGPMAPWVKQFALSKGMSHSVDLVGALPHDAIGPFLDSADLMVHLSPSETFGISSLEAIGAGLPVVSLRNGGAETTWGDLESECGVLLERTARPPEIAEAIAELKSTSERLDPIKGRRMVEERYSPLAVGESLVTIYGRVLSG